MLNIGPQELLLILVIALIVVGPQRLPALGRSIGRGLREIRKAQDEVKKTIQVDVGDEPAPVTQRPARTGAAAPTPQDPTPLASEPPPADEVAEISRTLGRSLHELRKAREEIRRTFRMSSTEPATRGSGSDRGATTGTDAAPAPATAPASSPGPPEDPDGTR